MNASGSDYADIAADGIKGNDVVKYIDSGSYALNALLSGSIYNGYPSNKCTGFGGETSTGKTYMVLSAVKEFLMSDEKASVIYFDTENAITSTMCVERGIDPRRIGVIGVATIEEFRSQAKKILDAYGEIEEKKRTPLLIVLDSLGMLSTFKETKDITEGNEKTDMTRAKLIRGAFRVLTLKSGRLGVPILITNHVYSQIGVMFPDLVMGGGCVVSGTRIMMSDGTLKDIEDIELGDLVKTLNGPRKVTYLWNPDNLPKKEVLRLTMEDGSCVECSVDHKFMIFKGDQSFWVEAKNLRENDQISTI